MLPRGSYTINYYPVRKLYPLLICLATCASLSAQGVETLKAGNGELLRLEKVNGPFDHPWAIAFLPDGNVLVTERNTGKLHRMSTEPDAEKTEIKGTPDVHAMGQGGLLDIKLDPDFANNQYVYLAYAKPGDGPTSTAALGRGRLRGDSIVDFGDIFVQQPWFNGPKHYGNQIAFSPDGEYLFFVMGERFQFEPAQDLGTHFGKVIRIRPDGTVPDDNPFVGRAGAQPEIWSYGHRNIESMAFHPDGELYLVEMGPLGGDELNRVVKGDNYGWPVESYGDHYDGRDMPDPVPDSPYHQPVRHWSPVISPSGMCFYSGDRFADWQGDAFVGGLSSRDLVRLTIDGDEVIDEERLPMPGRIREVEMGPDGALYLLQDDDEGMLWRLVPHGYSAGK